MVSALGSSFLRNRRTLRRMLFRNAFATLSPTALLYDGGGEYFGGASLLTSKVFGLDSGTTTVCVWFKLC